MNVIAVATIVVLVPLFAWAWTNAPGERARRQFLELWGTRPWGTQILVDFFALEAMLAVWMAADASARGAWVAWAIGVAAMPVFGAIPAAVYWLLRGL